MAQQSPNIVRSEIHEGYSIIYMDDGKNNLVSPSMIVQLNAALDEAEQRNHVVVLTGRAEVFSAGFDLAILKTGVRNTFDMLMGGFKLARRLLAFPKPVIIACNGHAIAMGTFILLSGDYRIGAKGPYKLVANEVEIGLTMPYSAVEICRQRLRPAVLDRAVLLSECFIPDAAIDAGFLDQVVEHQYVLNVAREKAEQFAQLDLNAHEQSKQRLRGDMLKAMDKAIDADRRDFVVKGVKRVLKIA
ncbi:MAG: crotonase/enoyl-CoA hydratase family protein [Oleiphilaceae bacterium]|nr:crotonase/enoyl-CoA hydratase family protein [Oleiphilaceae bacterium]